MKTRLVLAAAAAGIAAAIGSITAVTASAAPAPEVARSEHVVVVGISGLRWSQVTAAATPALWRLAGRGSIGSMVDYAELPLTCPADGWLTLNSGIRAQSDHTNATCGAFPAVIPSGTGAVVPGMSQILSFNNHLHNGPEWGLLPRSAACATAVGPGAALALATPAGQVASYLPDPAGLSAGALSRCPLTVVDLGNINTPERTVSLPAADTQLARIEGELPPDTTLLVVAPGATAKPPHLQVAIVSGPGYGAGMLAASSTRQPGMVVLTDLTRSVLGWLGSPVPPGVTGAQITRTDRGGLGSTVRGLAGRDTAEQVWRSSHSWFFWVYALLDAAVLGAIGLIWWGSAPERRRRRARLWRITGVFAAAVPAGTFLANLVPWWLYGHPAALLYVLAAVFSLVIAGAALAGPWRRDPADPLAPFGLICLLTLLMLGLDVMTGSRLQLETPFGLSVLEAGRFYGIGNEALGIYGVSALVAAAWLALRVRRRSQGRRAAAGVVTVIALFAVFASGWPGFGGKVGGTIAMVPCFVLLAMAVAGIKVNWRRAALIAVSGLALFAVFALVNYLVPATGKSDIGTFAGNLIHGQGGGLLLRKINSNVGSLTVNAFGPVVPAVMLLTGLMLWRPSAFSLRTAPQAYEAQPLSRVLMGVVWLVLLLGWLADDSGIIVPASAMPFVLPLGIAMLASLAYQDQQARYLGTALPGPSVAGQQLV